MIKPREGIPWLPPYSGTKVLNFCELDSLFITNTFIQHTATHLYICTKADAR